MSYIMDLASIGKLKIEKKSIHPPKSATGISDKSEVFVLLEGVIDFEREIERLEKEIDHRKQFITGIERKLQNKEFLSKAPKEVIQLERRKLDDSRQELEKLSLTLKALGE